MLTPPPTGVAPLQICLSTPIAGARTAWPMFNPKTGHDFIMLSRSRKVAVQLRVSAFWRVNGKLFEGQQPAPGKFILFFSLSGNGLARPASRTVVCL